MHARSTEWSRRGVLAGAGACVGGLVGWLARTRGPRRGSGLLRPPGALAEQPFLAACIRCGLCVEACPFDTLRLASPLAGLSAGTPFVEARSVPCKLCQGHDELMCIAACPTRALNPVREWSAIDMGVARIDRDACLAWNRTICRACWHVCPFPDEAIVLDWSGRPDVAADACIGCGMCVHACLTEPTSIAILPAEEFMEGDSTFVGEGAG